jgi:hypothetical protein
MIIIKMSGGLGNQMFQYAFGRGLSIEYDVSVKYDISGFQEDRIYRREFNLDCFNLTIDLLDEISIAEDKPGLRNIINRSWNRLTPYYKRIIVYEKIPYLFDSHISVYSNNKTYVGYWQSVMYFVNIENIIRNDFTFKDTFRKNSFLREINDCDSVGVHIRRYHKTKESYKNSIYAYISNEYYMNAIKYLENISPSIHLFIFSNDIEVAKEVIGTRLPTTYVSGQGYNDHEEMELLSNCKYQIISNSSFSWWAAWLNANPKKIVISPRIWFNRPDMNQLIVGDLLRPDWVIL